MASPRLTEPQAPRVGRHADVSPQSAEIDQAAIRDQLDRILASTVFRNSKRYSGLLKHVVERALDGRPEDLKERTIGVDVFGRAADYDTNTDHVVRSVAGEVRRRLAQYYMEDGRDSEVRIDLLAGSYVPQFRFAVEKPALAPETLLVMPQVSAAGTSAFNKRSVFVAGSILAFAMVFALGARFAIPASAFDQFWTPLFASPNAALLCAGGGGTAQTTSADPEQTVREFESQPSRRMHTSDALALAGLAGLLQANGKPYRILNRSGTTSFQDLQSGPFVLIGGMNNEWTLRLTKALRFSFERMPNGARVMDTQNPSNTSWAFDFTVPISQLSRDYAIVSRVRDPKTEQTAVIVAGIGSWGTQAASEFVSKPEHLKKIEAYAPRHWETKNLQVVIATDIIRASSGPPIIVATHFW